MHLLQRNKKENNNDTSLKIRQLPTEKYFQIIREHLALNGRATVRVTGVSMKPFLTPIRDFVEIIPPDASLKRGDIVLFDTHTGRYILHRVTRIGENDFDMRGDNTIQGEKNLPKEFIIGIVTCAEKNGRTIMRRSFSYKFYALFSPIHYTWKLIRHRLLHPVASKIYHILVRK